MVKGYDFKSVGGSACRLGGFFFLILFYDDDDGATRSCAGEREAQASKCFGMSAANVGASYI